MVHWVKDQKPKVVVACLNNSKTGKRLGDPNEESVGFESWSSVFWTSLYLELHFFDVDW